MTTRRMPDDEGGGVRTRQIQPSFGALHIAEQLGNEPALVLMHGFPDDSRIYDRLLSSLAPRAAVAFDFLGYGRSERATADVLGRVNHVNQLRNVLDVLRIETAGLVAHDASGPVAIDFALSAPERVGQLVLLNTYYGHSPVLRLPEMIRLLADPALSPLADAMLEDPNQRLWLLGHTASQFGADPLDPDGVEAVSVTPQFFGNADQHDALPAIRAWTAPLFAALDAQDKQIIRGRLSAVEVPVTLIFGADDQYLNPELAAHLAGLFRKAELHLVEGASHWPQWDQPEVVSELIR